MNEKIKALIFDAEQALTFAREAIDEKDNEALVVALHKAHAALESASFELEHKPTSF